MNQMNQNNQNESGKALAALIVSLLLFMAVAYTALLYVTAETGTQQLFFIGELKLWASKVVALFMVLIMLRFMDYQLGLSFKQWLEGASDVARSIYYSARVLAFCVLFGLA